MLGNWPAFPTPMHHQDSGMTLRHYAAVHILAGLMAHAASAVTRQDVAQVVEVAGWLVEEVNAACLRENPEAKHD